MSDTPRAYTSDELRDIFIAVVRDAAAYWASLPDHDSATGRSMSVRDRCDGVAFSILSLMDGSTLNMPAVDLVFQPHAEDKEDSIAEGENWIEPGTVVSDMLHEYFHKRRAPATQDADAPQP